MTNHDYISECSEKVSFNLDIDNNMGKNQIILHEQESLPEIYSIKKIFISITTGRIILQLDGQGERIYIPGTIIEVPRRTRMKIRNFSFYKTAILVMKL